MTADDVLAELDSLEDPRMRAVNEGHEDHHGVSLTGLPDVIEKEMQQAPDRLQWAMNHTLAQIGIEHEERRARALDIGERLGVLRDHPTPPNCTSPFAPLWINEMVRRSPA